MPFGGADECIKHGLLVAVDRKSLSKKQALGLFSGDHLRLCAGVHCKAKNGLVILLTGREG